MMNDPLRRAIRAERSRIYNLHQQLENRPETWTNQTPFEMRELQFGLAILDRLLAECAHENYLEVTRLEDYKRMRRYVCADCGYRWEVPYES